MRTCCAAAASVSARNLFIKFNPSQTEKLYKTAIRLGGITKNDVVIDAYCGIGTIGIALSSHAKKVIGVELNPQAVKDAQTNADLNHIKNIQFVNEDAGDFLVRYAEGGRADVVIMDPPRSGSTPEFLQPFCKQAETHRLHFLQPGNTGTRCARTAKRRL